MLCSRAGREPVPAIANEQRLARDDGHEHSEGANVAWDRRVNRVGALDGAPQQRAMLHQPWNKSQLSNETGSGRLPQWTDGQVVPLERHFAGSVAVHLARNNE